MAIENTFGMNIVPENDDQRLDALRRYRIVDTPSEESFDNIATLATQIFKVPIALISIVDAEKVFFKANVGMGRAKKTNRGKSLCALAVISEGVTVFEDALKEPCLMVNPNVVGDLGLRFYAGAPITTYDGFLIGTLCIIDKEPRTFTQDEKTILSGLAKAVMDQIELRLSALEEIDNQLVMNAKLQESEEELVALNEELCSTNAELVVMNDDLKQNDQRKNDFIGMVSHELKTPLTSLSGYIQMLQVKADKHQDVFFSAAIQKANKQVDKMTLMINSFLNISRLDSGKIQIDFELFDVAQLIKEVEDETDNIISSHNISFAHIESTFINADHDKIGHVITNLISNAVKYSSNGTTIKIACVADNGWVQVSVEDQGMGIAPKDLERLFDRYYRVEGDHMKTISGFGIGLYLCAEIIQRHGGKIWVTSEFGIGSTFYFSLPMRLLSV